MKYIDSPWALALIMFGFFVFVETLHMIEHKHCRECPTCEITENY